MRPNRRIVVAMIYWEEMANNVNDQDWYVQKIKQAIKVGFPSGKSRSFRASKILPNRQNRVSRTMACMKKSYKQAALNVMVVGNVVGELVKYMKNEFASDISYTTFCIGLSLGSHTCGFLGKSSKMVDKIFAIDPAGPIFDHHPPDFRLDRGDATVVHALHTSSGYYGLEDPIADVDFYPNGLWNNQPLDCPNSASFKCGCPKAWTSVHHWSFPWHYNNQGCSHIWGIEFLTRVWEQKSESWYCNSTVYCNSMSGYFPLTKSMIDIGQRNVSIQTL